MIKILLADTDALNIKNFRNFLRITYPSIKDIKNISNPNIKILELLKNESVNLIVADIKFFGFNNYQILKSIHEEFPSIKLILYGGYNESEYLKSSLNFGVINYMYKPVKPLDFNKSMEMAIQMLKSDEKRQQEEAVLKGEYLEEIKLFQDKFLTNLLHGYLKDDSEIYRSFDYFKMDFDDKFCVFTIRIDHFTKIILTLDEMEKHLLIFKLLSTINKNLNKNKYKAVINSFNSISVIASGELDQKELINLSERIKNYIFEYMKVRVTIGIGKIYENPRDITISYNESEASLRYRFYLGYNSIIHIDFVEPNNNVTYRYPLEKENRLVYAAVVGEYEYCKMLLDEIIDSLKSSGELPDKLAPKIILNILVSISRFASEQNILKNKHFSKFFSFSECLEITSLDEAYNYLDKALKEFCEYVVSIHEENDLKLLERAKDYIEENYFKTLKLQKFAYEFKTTPDYLNNLFLEKEGKGFVEYLANKRISVAKEIIKETDCNDDMVALKVGYNDPRQFRMVFKQCESMFTHEYRALQSYPRYNNI